MQEGFDPYRKWLGIPPAEQPPNHYRLLGVPLFEDDAETISNAADQRVSFVRTLAVSQYADITQRVLNELAAAKVCLLNPDKKAAYDRQLRARDPDAPPRRAVLPPRSNVPPKRPTDSPPPRSAHAPAPARVVPPNRAADFDPLPLPLMPDLPPISGVPARRIRPLPSTTRRPRSGPTSRSSDRPLLPLAVVAGLLVVTVLAAVGLIRVVRNQGGGDAVTVDPGQIDPQPASSVPLPTSTPEPPKPAPQPPENHPPNIEIVSVEPETPEAGGSLTVLLTGQDPEGDAIAFEYRTGPNSPWQIATDGRVTVSGLQPGMLSMEIRARDSVGHLSDVKMLAKEIRAVTTSPPQVLGLYALRTAPKREEWVAQLGGTPASETAVGMGLEWLARHQMEDGYWGPDCLGHSPDSRCEKQHVCEGAPGGAYEAALTGLALLALQAGGHYDFNEHSYSGHVAKGLNRLVDQQGRNGELVGSVNVLSDKFGVPSQYHAHYMYEHAIATFALAEACAVARASTRHPDAKLLDAAIKAEKFIEAQQHHDGGWRYGGIPLSAPSDCSVSGWAMLALKSCREAEIPVSDRTFSRMVSFFKNQEDPLTGRTHYQTPSFTTDALTGVGMLINQFVTHQADSPLNALAARYLAGIAESQWGPGVAKQPHDYYLWYNCTLAMYQSGGEPWERWNKIIRDDVQSLQVHSDGCDRGSWAPDDQWSGYGGRIYSTALATLTLEVYYRFAKPQSPIELGD